MRHAWTTNNQQPYCKKLTRTMQNDIRKNIETKINQKLIEEEFEKLSKWFVPIRLENKKQFVNEGKVCRNLYFVNSGATQTFIFDKKGEIHTTRLTRINYFFLFFLPIHLGLY